MNGVAFCLFVTFCLVVEKKNGNERKYEVN